jgi:hypothetical protein
MKWQAEFKGKYFGVNSCLIVAEKVYLTLGAVVFDGVSNGLYGDIVW